MFSDEKKVDASDALSKGEGFISLLNNINTAVKDTYLTFKGDDNVFEKLTEKLTSMENSSVGLLRSMGGVFNLMKRSDEPAERVKDTIGQFQERLLGAAKGIQDFGGSFKDVTEVTEGLADVMGRVVFPSQTAMENMVALSKTTGLTNKEIASMVEKVTSFGGTQKEATEKIHEMAVVARRVGLDASKFVKEMSANIDKVGGFGFKDGVKSLERMTKQAQMLKTTFGGIVGTLQETVLDPEGAINAAARFQMLGGAVGKLADPFQLMYMAQNDMEGLQKELVKSTQAAFQFNSETGEFKASTQDLYRLREQASITGVKFEDLVKTGREAAKLDYIKDKFNMDGLSDDNKELLSGLAQVGKGGEVTIDIPGYGSVTEASIKSGEAAEALKEYQQNAALDEKQIAIKQLTTTENNAKDVEIIKNAVLYSLTGNDAKKREEILKAMADNQATYNAGVKDMGKEVGAEIGKGASGVITNIQTKAAEEFEKQTGYGNPGDVDRQNEIIGKVQKGIDAMGDIFKGGVTPTEDLFLPEGGRPKVLSEGKIYQGIVGDEVAMGTNLSEAFNKVSTIQDLMSAKSKGATSQNIDGNLKIDINVGGRVDGDKNADISKIFSSPQFQKQLMDMVLYKMKDYQKQQGVL
jgi:tetrahydromethanopterin S-methyltransferase subunit A